MVGISYNRCVFISFNENSVKIVNSNQIDSRYERIKVSKIIENTYDDGTKITQRTAFDLSAEWYGHNVINSIYDNDRTRDVDLDYSFSDNKTYTIIGTLVLLIYGIV